ncbi:MAG TPA: ribbon-helix-helix domain-containing protein [Kofleriaceae bacterium]|nr:ribbon-helix-helix domain-containing protein [Kofleriaceae bacterium]
MIRTQISVTEAQKRRLDARAAETGLSLSDLVRRAIDHLYPETRDQDADTDAILQALGAWKDRDYGGEAYVDRMRPGHRLGQ